MKSSGGWRGHEQIIQAQPNIDLTGGATRMLRTEKGRKRSVPPGLSPVPAAGPRLSRADMRPPRDRAAGTQHRRAGARSSFCPLPPWALGRDVALSPTRVQKDQVVAKVGSHCAACARASWGWGWGVRGRVAPRAPVGRVRACSTRRWLAPRAGGGCAGTRMRGGVLSLPPPRAKTRSRAPHSVGMAPGP